MPLTANDLRASGWVLTGNGWRSPRTQNELPEGDAIYAESLHRSVMAGVDALVSIAFPNSQTATPRI